jgi:hypothetical protein
MEIENTLNKFFEYVHLEGVEASSEMYLTFFIMSFIVGFIVLNWRYIINPLDKEEQTIWRKEPLLIKITLATIVGLTSYLGSMMAIECLDSLSYLINGELAFNLKIFDIMFILISSIYGFGLMYLFSRRYKKRLYQDIQWLVVFTMLLILPLTGLSIFFMLSANGKWVLGLFFLGMLTFIEIGILSPFIRECFKIERKEKTAH